jgi:hypothetical protein
MASNGATVAATPETVLAAIVTLRGGDTDKKKVAMDYLSKFQKSVSCPPRPAIPDFHIHWRPVPDIRDRKMRGPQL